MGIPFAGLLGSEVGVLLGEKCEVTIVKVLSDLSPPLGHPLPTILLKFVAYLQVARQTTITVEKYFKKDRSICLKSLT